jgi:hypothetical protein
MKRKLILTPLLATLAVVMAPIASASANHSVLKGTCYVEGTATFASTEAGFKGLGFDFPLNPVTKATYSFESKKLNKSKNLGGKENTCEGSAEEYNEEHKSTGVKEEGKFTVVTATVTASAVSELECGTHSKDGKGNEELVAAEVALTVKGPGGHEFTAKAYFHFVATTVAGEIEVKLDSKKGGGGNKASGFANFTNPGGEPAARQCAEHEALHLPFETATVAPPPVGSAGLSGTVGEP